MADYPVHHTDIRWGWLALARYVHWRSNHVRYWMSHRFHHKYTLHKASEAERVVPRVQTAQQILLSATQADQFGFRLAFAVWAIPAGEAIRG